MPPNILSPLIPEMSQGSDQLSAVLRIKVSTWYDTAIKSRFKQNLARSNLIERASYREGFKLAKTKYIPDAKTALGSLTLTSQNVSTLNAPTYIASNRFNLGGLIGWELWKERTIVCSPSEEVARLESTLSRFGGELESQISANGRALLSELKTAAASSASVPATTTTGDGSAAETV